MMGFTRISVIGLAFLALALLPVQAATLLNVDARQQPAAPETGYFHFGTSVSPKGDRIGINNRYLLLNGKPWLPVMGEFHFTRYPNKYWDEELAKMKTAGVDIVSTYVIWDHLETSQGHFNWSGDRDLRRFIALCAKHDLKVFIRLGPWVHSEARFGGVPDYVVHATRLRSTDPVFLHYVGRFWDQIAAQVKGQFWKDGGPIIGVQIANEYNLTGPGQGREYVAALKKMALEKGFDVPLYTVTGWDNTVYPRGEVVPVEGGYADEPWGLSTGKNPPSEVYAFRFDSRVRGNLGAETTAVTTGDAEADAPHTPFLGAEFGGGVPTMYRRRPIMAPDDIAAMLPVELGSGVNLYGYYMFHGGQNSPDHDEMQESTAIGGYNDLPMIDYDFQAPLGAYGQQHAVMEKIRPFHYFLQAFGGDLAPMAVHRPAILSKGASDLETPRFAVRSLGDSGFLFVSNYVRQYPMAVQKDVQFAVQLPGGAVTLPAHGIDIPSGAYFIWPVNMDLSGAKLIYATAQPIMRLMDGVTPVYVFHAQKDIAAEFAIDGAGVASVTANGVGIARDGSGRFIADKVEAGSDAHIDIALTSGGKIRILLLTPEQADHLSLVTLENTVHLVLSDSQLYGDGDGLDLLSMGDPHFALAVYPALLHSPSASLVLKHAADGLFERFVATAPARDVPVTLTQIRDAQPVPPLTLGVPSNTAHEPMPETFGKSAAWSISIGGPPLKPGEDDFLQIRARGDVGRLFASVTMLDDHFLDGSVWEIGLKRFATQTRTPLTLTVLPLRADAPIYLDGGVAAMVTGEQTAEVTSVEVVPQYRLHLQSGK
jgi:hypothetical protein